MKRVLFFAILVLSLSSTIVHADDVALLSEAVSNGNAAQVKAMLDKNVNVNAADEYGFTPLHYAKRKDIAALLLAQGADVNAKNEAEGDTPLHYAILYAEKGVVELLLAKGSDINAKRRNGETPLILAVKSEKKDFVELLLAKHANVNATTDGGSTALHVAVYKGPPAIATLLVNKGADINAQQKEGATPLHMAVKESRIDMIKLLIGHGADTSLTNSNGKTPLDDAISGRNTEIVALLLKVELLLKKGAPVNAVDKSGRTPLYIVAQYGNEHLAGLLLAKGANVNATSANGRTPIFGAAAFNNKTMAVWLLSKGARLDVKDVDANTPLHAAVQHEDSSEIISWLLDYKADINARNNNGSTALRLANDKSNFIVGKFLREKGADSSIMNNKDEEKLARWKANRIKDESEHERTLNEMRACKNEAISIGDADKEISVETERLNTRSSALNIRSSFLEAQANMINNFQGGTPDYQRQVRADWSRDKQTYNADARQYTAAENTLKSNMNQFNARFERFKERCNMQAKTADLNAVCGGSADIFCKAFIKE